MKTPTIKWFRLVTILFAAGILFGVGFLRLTIDTDVVGSLPQDDPVLSNAVYIFQHHPMHDQLFIDVTTSEENLDNLVKWGDRIETELISSGLFQRVGIKDLQGALPELVWHVIDDLPAMFSERQLEETVKPLLETEQIERHLAEIQARLLSMDGIGQARFISTDPLDLKNLVMARMAPLIPSGSVRIHREKLISSDGKHLLLIAKPATAGTDTAFARKLTALFRTIETKLAEECAGSGGCPVITPVGAYRAALDNEDIIRQDVGKALTLSTIGVALLLLLAFPRPLIGLMSLLPAVAGTMTALFVYSLVYRSISIIVLGFGGAIISITVDQGIAYLLFIDRPCPTKGKDASREIWAVGLVAVLTTVVAFLTLLLSGFPIFAELGLFTALGLSFSFLFVHTLFPLVFPEMPPAMAPKKTLQRIVNWMCASGKPGAVLAFIFGVVMLFFARPVFNADIHNMNTVSKDTLAAEKMMTDVWGNVFENRKVFLMFEGDGMEDLQRKGDRLLEMLDQDLDRGVLSTAFTPSMLFPGEKRRRENRAAWKAFWNQTRIADLKTAMARPAADLGFTPDAFDPFFNTIEKGGRMGTPEIPKPLWEMLGILKNPEGSKIIQFASLTTAEEYVPETFQERYSKTARIFDQAFFAQRLGRLLSTTFGKMFLIISISVVIQLLLMFFDLTLTAIALAPIVFAFSCTLGTLHLLGRPLDIPGLMLAIIILGMGIDYSLFYIRSYQRYQYEAHPSFSLIKMAVFMAAASTLIGFGVLCIAEHSLLQSVGIVSLLGIGYSLIGAFVLLPPILQYYFRNREGSFDTNEAPAVFARRQYRLMETYPRLFARFKLQTDPMFAELPQLLQAEQDVRTIIDIGCGFGIPAVWCLAAFRQARIFGLEPDDERVRVASRAVGDRGVIVSGRAPDVPEPPEPADFALMLDMVHYLTDEELALVLRRLHSRLKKSGRLYMRATISPEKKYSLLWWVEHIRLQLLGMPANYRTIDELTRLMERQGFSVERTQFSGNNGDLVWFIGGAT